MSTSENITVLRDSEGRRYYIIGTAHVSEQSIREVEETIEEIHPDVVCVELCESRYQALVDEDRWKKLDIFKVIREGKTLFLLATLALGAYQRRLGAQLGVKPGAELLAGVKKAKEIGAELCLADRDIHTTLKRTWANLNFWQKAKLLNLILISLFESQDESLDVQEIEALKAQSNLSEIMQEFAKTFPQVHGPLIDERDRYLVSKIKKSKGQKVVAVVGAGHVPGIRRYFDQEIEAQNLEQLPPPSSFWKWVKWVIPTLIVFAFAWGWHRHGGESIQHMLTAWILPNAFFAALFTALAGGKWLSTLTAALASPITSLNPLLGAGMVVGLLEAWLRKPTVEDAEKINEDVQSFRGLYRNAFTRVLLVAVASTMGSALGAWVGGAWLFALLI